MRSGVPIRPSQGRPGAWGSPGHRILAALALFRSAGWLSGFPGGLLGPSETSFGAAIIASGENPARRSRGGSGRRGLPPRGRIWPKSLCFPVAPGSLGGARIGPSGAAAGPGAGGRWVCGRQRADVGTCHVTDRAPAQPLRHTQMRVPRMRWSACAARAAGAPAQLNFSTEIRAPRAQRSSRAPQPSFNTV